MKILKCLLVSVFSYCLLSCSNPIKATSPQVIFGSTSDINYAEDLWLALEKQQLVGNTLRPVEPIVGAALPHGWILEIINQNVTVRNHEGFVVVKRNYDDKTLTVEKVKADRQSNLSSITVMFKREAGYDPENKNWFWVKYKPGGNLFSKTVDGNDLAIAGRVKKGATPEQNGGCIYCHSSAGGGDYIFYPDIKINAI